MAEKTIRVSFTPPAVQPARATKRPPPPDQITGLDVSGAGSVGAVTVDAPLLSALVTGAREKRRRVPLDHIPRAMREAVLAIEDRRFYDHPGVDIIRTIGAVVTNLRGDKPYLVGGSTLTQQLVKNSFLTRDKTMKRKLQEQMMALILERRLSRTDLGSISATSTRTRGSFAITASPSGADDLRQGRLEPLAGRGRHDCRHDPGPADVLAVSLPRPGA
jgi:hypothetical protein